MPGTPDLDWATKPAKLLGIQRTYRNIQDVAAKSHHGVVVSRFSQGIPPVSDFCKTQPLTYAGICRALSNRWIADHANDRSMWNAFYTSSGAIQLGVIRALLAEQVRLSVPGMMTQLSELYLAQHKVLPRKNVVSGASRSSMGGDSLADPTLYVKILGALDALTSSGGAAGGTYFSLSFGGGPSIDKFRSHCVAGHLGSATRTARQSDVAFFDPNFGDFWFPTVKDFQNWFKWYWHRTDYKSDFGVYEIHPYGRAAG